MLASRSIEHPTDVADGELPKLDVARLSTISSLIFPNGIAARCSTALPPMVCPRSTLHPAHGAPLRGYKNPRPPPLLTTLAPRFSYTT